METRWFHPVRRSPCLKRTAPYGPERQRWPKNMQQDRWHEPVYILMSPLPGVFLLLRQLLTKLVSYYSLRVAVQPVSGSRFLLPHGPRPRTFRSAAGDPGKDNKLAIPTPGEATIEQVARSFIMELSHGFHVPA